MRKTHELALIIVWLLAFAVSAAAGPVGNSLRAGEVLLGDQSGYVTPSPNSISQGTTLRLVMQPDCNLVLYLGWGVLWNSGTNGRGSGCRAIMQGDGNFVVYTGQNQPIFASNSQGNPGAYLLIQNDGNVVVYNGNHQALWSTGTDISYDQTCQSTSASGPPPIQILNGTCKNFFGQWQQSSVPIGCAGIVSNVDGVLRCVISENMGFDLVSVSFDSSNQGTETKVWRIDRPNVRVGEDPLPMVTFRPGDSIRFNAGGCVQTGGSGLTWKSYVDPQGVNADHFYSGRVQIPGVIGSPMRIAGAKQNSPWPVPFDLTPQTKAQLYLRLRYEDDDYGDNGYWGHDDGNPPQCVGIGPAWVEVTVESGQAGGEPVWSPGSKPFDLVWNLMTGVDANGLPLNPIWFSQVAHPGTKLDFQNTCGPAFVDGLGINAWMLSMICTTQAPDADIDTGLDFVTLGLVCPANPVHGHLNWGSATYTGRLTWQGWTGDTGFWEDGDYNFGLSVPNNAGLASGTPDDGPGLHLEFNESEVEFAGPLWKALFEAVQGSSGDPARLVNGKTAVVTGLFGIDGVHNGGYSESHPVYAMAVLTSTTQGQNSLDQTWDFFIKNFGNEGMCSERQHFWDGESGVYYIEFPWPMDSAGRRAIDVSEGPTQAWFWSTPGPALLSPAPQLDVDQEPAPMRSYLQVALPGASGLSGQITLHYTIPSDFLRMTQQMAQEINIAPKSGAVPIALKGPEDDHVDLDRVISDPIARRRIAALPNPYRTAPRRNVVAVHVFPNIVVLRPPAGPARNGALTRDRTGVDPLKAKWHADLARARSKAPVKNNVERPPIPH
jgi:hypothetical protein